MTILDHDEWVGAVWDMRPRRVGGTRLHVARHSHPAGAVAGALYELTGSDAPIYREGPLWAVGLPDGSLWEGDPVHDAGDGLRVLLVPAAAWDMMGAVRRVVDVRGCVSFDTWERVRDEVWLGRWADAAAMAAQARFGLRRVRGRHVRHFGRDAALICDEWLLRV